MRNTFVIRARGEKKGHIFYEYTSKFDGKKYMGCEKVKYATEFKTQEEAEKVIKGHEGSGDYEVVSLELAELEYYCSDHTTE